MIGKILLVAFLLGLGLFIVIRRIVKLPSRYERKPQALSPWSALDRGIDPTETSESK